MTNDVYKQAVHMSTCAFAHCQGVFDAEGKMVDYVFLDVNPAFEELTGLKRDAVLNRRLVEEVARNKEQAKHWVSLYEPVVRENAPIDFEEYAATLERHYHVRGFPTGEGRFIALLEDTTFSKNIEEISSYLIAGTEGVVDYNKITQFALDVSGASYAAFNLVGDDGKSFSTVSVRGIPENLNRAMALLRFDVVGKTWAYDPAKEGRTRGNDLTVFQSLRSLTGDVIPAQIVAQIEKVFGLGETVVSKIRKEEKVLGDFTLFFKKSARLKNRELMLLYLSLLGLFLEKNRLYATLDVNRKMFVTLAEYAPVGFLSCNTKGEILYANKALLEILDSPSQEATKSINLLTLPRLKANGFAKRLQTTMDTDRPDSFEMEYTSLWGSTRWLRVHIIPTREKELPSGAIVVFNDITESKKNEDFLFEMAHRDALTRAYNRNALETVVAERLSESAALGLIGCIGVVDVDGFKNINDTFGHKAGDGVLKSLAAGIQLLLSEKDVLVRTGGDEFLVYLHDVKTKENADAVLRRIFEGVSTSYTLETGEGKPAARIAVQCSIGAAIYPKNGDSVEALMSRADDALYAVKNSGKADVRFAD